MKKISIFLPGWAKTGIRLVVYKEERRKFIKEINIKNKQNALLPEIYKNKSKKLIVFVVSGPDWFTGEDRVTGGILSIASIYHETCKLKELHGAEVIMCTGPGEYLLIKHTQFENNIPVFRFEQIFNYFTSLQELMFHIPEFLVKSFLKKERNRFLGIIKGSKNVHINILNQNIRLLPDPFIVQGLNGIASTVTQTTAHEKYTTLEIRKKWGIPLHKFSVFGSPEKYKRQIFEEKEDLIIISPDENPEKEAVLLSINKILISFEKVVIKNMTYQVYLETIGKAKLAITFGEGLDFYFLETVFSGGIGFAVFNEEFFPLRWKELPGIYSSYDEMIEKLPSYLEAILNDRALFMEVQEKQYLASSDLYSYTEYQENIRQFYMKNYLFP